MLIAFFDSEGIVYQHFVTDKTTVDSDYYGKVLTDFRKHISRICPRLKATWMLRQDSARSHTSSANGNFMLKNRVETLRHPPYSPDLAPCNFGLFL